MLQTNKQRKLDLGGTACYGKEESAVGITLDGTMSNQDHNLYCPTPYVIGDYNHAPFPSDTFDEAFGCCYLEERVDWFELRRLMKAGASVQVSSCDEWTPTDSESLESFWSALTQAIAGAQAAEFELVSLEPRDAGIEGNIAMPTVTLRAPS